MVHGFKGAINAMVRTFVFPGLAALTQAQTGPVLTSLSPSSATAGGPAFTLTVNGSGFIPTMFSLQGPVPGSVVQWNGTALTTTFVSTTQLTAAVPASDIASAGTAQVTTGGGSGMSNNALTFTIAVSPLLSILPQFVFGGFCGNGWCSGWYSALYFTNTTNGAVSFPVNFTADNGTPLTVPALGGASTTVDIPALGTAIIEAPITLGSLSQGYATFTLPPGVWGYGVFRQSVPGRADQEAVVPFATANATSGTLVWDDTAFVTSVAVANAGPVAATIAVTLWDNNGNVVATSTVNLPAGQKTEAALRSLPGLAGMVGLRGRAQFAATSGNVAVLGLRFNSSAFTSIPAQQ